MLPCASLHACFNSLCASPVFLVRPGIVSLMSSRIPQAAQLCFCGLGPLFMLTVKRSPPNDVSLADPSWLKLYPFTGMLWSQCFLQKTSCFWSGSQETSCLHGRVQLGQWNKFLGQESHSVYVTKLTGFNAGRLCCHSKIHNKGLNYRIILFWLVCVLVSSPRFVSPSKAGIIHVYILYCSPWHTMDVELR